MIQEHNLVNFGFVKNEIDEWDTGYKPTHYYTRDFGHPQHGLCLITNCEVDVEKDGGWFVEIFNTEGFKRVTDMNELKQLIDTFEKLEKTN